MYNKYISTSIDIILEVSRNIMLVLQLWARLLVQFDLGKKHREIYDSYSYKDKAILSTSIFILGVPKNLKGFLGMTGWYFPKLFLNSKIICVSTSVKKISFFAI